MQLLTVTRNLGNATSFQAGSKSFGLSVALTMRYEALDSDGKESRNGKGVEAVTNGVH